MHTELFRTFHDLNNNLSIEQLLKNVKIKHFSTFLTLKQVNKTNFIKKKNLFTRKLFNISNNKERLFLITNIMQFLIYLLTR